MARITLKLSGRRIGRLHVLRDSGTRHPVTGSILWLCICQCGRKKLIETSCLSKKKNGVLSCGCLHRERAAQFNRTHGARSMHVTPGVKRAYSSWQNMKTRCMNPHFNEWAEYGGRGITITKRWLGVNGFRAFLADLGERPEGKTLDRINGNKNYEPGNCRWASAEVQAINQRRFYIDGKPPAEVPMRCEPIAEGAEW